MSLQAPQSGPAARLGRFAYALVDRLLRTGRADRLTVLCYHRVVAPDPARFQGFRTNISAAPETFRAQMEYLARHFSPVALPDLTAFLREGRPLPPRPALVTFDDGYRDNGEVAWPILRACGVPATVFLATDHIGAERPFVWDYAAYCLERTPRMAAPLTLLGGTSLETPAEREDALVRWIEALKRRPGEERWPRAHALAAALGVDPPAEAFRDLTLSWSDVTRLMDEGLGFGGHTRSHPILSRLPAAEARAEIAGSRARIAEATGRAPIAFAYPNGAQADFTPAHEADAREAGYDLAFSMEPGPTDLAQAARRPFAIPRIYVGLDDDMPRFALKLAGAARLRARLRRPRQAARPI